MSREIRDILAECMREERIGPAHPSWAELPVTTHEYLRGRADRLLRLLDRHGVALVQAGEGEQLPPELNAVVWRDRMVEGDGHRQVRRAVADQWCIERVDGDHRYIDHQFDLQEAQLHAGEVLTGDLRARTRNNLGKELAAALMIFIARAETMGAVDE